jgi:hypothetical protein
LNNDYPPLNEVMVGDPLGLLSLGIFVVLFAATCSIWIYIKKDKLSHLWKKITNTGSHIMLGCPPVDQLVTIINGANVMEIKNVVKEATPSLAAITLIIVHFLPSGMARGIVMNNPADINTGEGRMWTYISRVTVPIISYCILPAVIIGTNSNMYFTLIRELKGQPNW